MVFLHSFPHSLMSCGSSCGGCGGCKALVVIVALLTTACATPFSTFGLNPEQLAAAAKAKDASVLCVEANVMLGANTGSLVIASVDKGIAAKIVVDARGKCTVGLVTEK